MTDRSRVSKRLATKHPPSPVYQLKVTLLEIEPPVWRRILVPGSITLDHLHTVIQEVMGWEDGHLHEFEVNGRRYGEPDPDEPDANLEPERKVTLNEVASEAGQQFEYLYDFGDGWSHELLVERIEAPEKAGRYPTCLAGERSCPSEDCGGPYGYEDFLKAIRNPSHPEHREMLEWTGGAFDPEAFDLTAINRKLEALK